MLLILIKPTNIAKLCGKKPRPMILMHSLSPDYFVPGNMLPHTSPKKIYRHSENSLNSAHLSPVLGTSDRYDDEFFKDLKNYQRQCYALLELVFPEFSSTSLKNPFGLATTSILKRFPTASHLAEAKVKQIEKFVRSIQGNNFSISDIKQLINTAKSSIYSGRASDARGTTVKMLLTNIRGLNSHITELDSKIEDILSPSSPNDFDSFPGANLLSIPGIGKKHWQLFFLVSELTAMFLLPVPN